MTFKEFEANLKEKMVLRKVMNNPGGGTSIIIAHTCEGNICYKRKESCISIPITEIYNAYNKYKGGKCTSGNLKTDNPEVFSFKAHVCNCTFLFMVLHEMKLCSEPKREGKGNSQFYVEMF
ncbi:hypothetical protein FACS1894147_00010 [Spirochaetia bacterium]|nr:hypothetical protein FACS1894147_00010 [Spirochaetia bacterium]